MDAGAMLGQIKRSVHDVQTLIEQALEQTDCIQKIETVYGAAVLDQVIQKVSIAVGFAAGTGIPPVNFELTEQESSMVEDLRACLHETTPPPLEPLEIPTWVWLVGGGITVGIIGLTLLSRR